ARQPFVLEAADLHWADGSTLAWVASLVADPPPGLLVVATSREHQAAFDGADVIPLGPLDDDAARLVAKQLIGDADVDVDEIVARCDGVPLYVDQVARAASRSGEGTIPLGLRDVVQAKLLRPEVDQQLAQVLSTIGRDCTPAFVADVTRR